MEDIENIAPKKLPWCCSHLSPWFAAAGADFEFAYLHMLALYSAGNW